MMHETGLKLAKNMNAIFLHSASVPKHLIPSKLKTSYNEKVMKIHANVQGRIAARMINSHPESCRKRAMDALFEGGNSSSEKKESPSEEHRKLMDIHKSTFKKTVIKKVVLPTQQP